MFVQRLAAQCVLWVAENNYYQRFTFTF